MSPQPLGLCSTCGEPATVLHLGTARCTPHHEKEVHPFRFTCGTDVPGWEGCGKSFPWEEGFRVSDVGRLCRPCAAPRLRRSEKKEEIVSERRDRRAEMVEVRRTAETIRLGYGKSWGLTWYTCHWPTPPTAGDKATPCGGRVGRWSGRCAKCGAVAY